MSRLLTIRIAGATLGAVAALGGASAIASAAPVTAPPTAFQTTPPSLNFGTVLVDGSITKPVKLINRTKSTLYYDGARWPNFGNPVGWEYPYGFWNVSGSGPDFPCYAIAPKSSCTLMFEFKPYSAGVFSTYFEPTYNDGITTFSDTTEMRGVGLAPPS